MDLRELFADPERLSGQTVRLEGWIRNHRRQKGFGGAYNRGYSLFRLCKTRQKSQTA